MAACGQHMHSGSTSRPPNIPDKIPDPVMVITTKLTKGTFHQGYYGNSRATKILKFYSTWVAKFRISWMHAHQAQINRVFVLHVVLTFSVDLSSVNSTKSIPPI
jgi:hypothetical protein